MNRQCEAPDNQNWEELVALEALGVLPEHEAGKVRAHLSACESCATEFQRDRAAADMLGALLPEATDALRPKHPERLKTRVLRAARAAREPASKSGAFIDFSPGIRWQVTRGNNVTLVKWLFEPPLCGDIPDEVHTFTQSGVVLDGSFSLLYRDGRRQFLRKQDVYTIPPGIVHGATFHERTILFDVYSPNHAEFEEQYSKQIRERERAENRK